MRESLNKLILHLDKTQTLLSGTGSWQDKRTDFLNSLNECGELAITAGFPGLLDLCMIFRDCLDTWPGPAGREDEVMDITILQTWPDTIRKYIESPETEDHKASLIQIISYPAWGNNISD